MFTKTSSLRIAQLVITLVFLLSGLGMTRASGQPRIDPASPIDQISYSLDDSRKFLIITVVLRQLPTTAAADLGVPLTAFRIGNLRSATETKIARVSATSNDLNKLYKIEISTTMSEDDIRLTPTWNQLSFFVTASYSKPGEGEIPYESPKFTIVRNIQLPTIKVGTPNWQAENSSSGTITKYLSVMVTPTESMKVNVELSDATGLVARSSEALIGGNDPTNVELNLLPNRTIAAGIKYKVTVKPGDDNKSVTTTSEWTPSNFTDNYRLSDKDEKLLSAFPSVETDKVKLAVQTLVPGKTLRLIAEGLPAGKVKLLPGNTSSNWEFEVDLTGVPQKTIPFYFDGEGGNGQVFVGNDKRYFFNLNNDLRVDGALTISFSAQNEMVVSYKLNRKADAHRLRLEVPGVLELTDLPVPVSTGENAYKVTAKTSVTSLLTGLVQALKADNTKSFPVKFKLIVSEAAPKPFAEFAISAYGVTTGDYLKKIAGISELVGTSNKFDKADDARKAVLDKLGLQSPPTDPAESKTVESIVDLLTKQSNKDDRRKSFWGQLAGYALKVIPPLVGIPIGL